MKTITFLAALSIACSNAGPSAPPPNERFACDESARCPADQNCIQGCCGGPPCSAQTFACSTNAECGTDQKCSGGQCVSCETIGCLEIGDAGTQDLATQPADMKDPYAWNPGQPRGPAAGCSSGQGWVLTPKLHACPGKCNANTCQTLCTSGWSTPTTLTIPEAACLAVPWGAFASLAHSLDTGAPPGPVARCDWEAPTATWNNAYRLGCGPIGRVFAGPAGNRVYTYQAMQKCGGFPLAIRCSSNSAVSMSETPFYCDVPGTPYKESYFNTSNLGITTTPSDGVLCAQP